MYMYMYLRFSSLFPPLEQMPSHSVNLVDMGGRREGGERGGEGVGSAIETGQDI